MTFTGFDTEGIRWLQQLKENNSREWYQAHKVTYRSALEEPARHLLAFIEGKAPGYAGKIFRLQRDLRFSKDKTPYNCHLRIAWSAANRASLYFSLEPDKLILGSGLLAFDPVQLARFRHRMMSDPDSLKFILSPLLADGYRLSEPELKTTPARLLGERDAGPYLRHKSLCLWREQPIPAVLHTDQAAEWCWQQWRVSTGFRDWLNATWETQSAI